MKYLPAIGIILCFVAFAWASNGDYQERIAEAGHTREIMLAAKAEKDADNREYKRPAKEAERMTGVRMVAK